MDEEIESTKTILEKLYEEKVNALLGFDADSLTLSRCRVTLKDCTGCTQPFTVSDSGLEEDNVALFGRMCEKLDTSFCCAGYEKAKNFTGKTLYRFCYNEPCVQTIKNAIKRTDLIRAIDRARYNTLTICIRRISHHKNVDEDFVNKNFECSSNSIISERNAMWYEIDEGLRRLLVMPAEKWKNEEKIEGDLSEQNGLALLTLHGHQLRHLVRADRYNVAPQKPDIICMGHYHLQAVLREFDTWVLMTGHFLSYRAPRRKGFLCHIGAPILLIEKGSNRPFFKLLRGSEPSARQY
jgi:uncharacterized protein YbaR (Trm112 family)